MVPGLGVRCVSDQPWVTVAETCELVLALDACGQRDRRPRGVRGDQHLRHDDGSYWTGWQYANQAHFPAERSGWTSAAVILAADALAGFSGGAAVFRAASRRPRRPAAGRPGLLRLRHRRRRLTPVTPASPSPAAPLSNMIMELRRWSPARG